MSHELILTRFQDETSILKLCIQMKQKRPKNHSNSFRWNKGAFQFFWSKLSKTQHTVQTSNSRNDIRLITVNRGICFDSTTVGTRTDRTTECELTQRIVLLVSISFVRMRITADFSVPRPPKVQTTNARRLRVVGHHPYLRLLVWVKQSDFDFIFLVRDIIIIAYLIFVLHCEARTLFRNPYHTTAIKLLS